MMKISDKVIKKISELGAKGQEFYFIIDFTGENSEVFLPEEASAQGIFFSFEGKTNFNYAINNLKLDNAPYRFDILPVKFEEYNEAFAKVQQALHRGDTYLLNLTFRTQVFTDLTLSEIFHRSAAKYKLLYKNKFVVFSPERFVHIGNGLIETRPMKGTISAETPNAEEMLMSNRKEIFEHNTIVDLLRNDLNMVADDVRVEKFRYIDRLYTNKGEILQVSSLIRGNLPAGYESQLGEIITRLLPAGSVTGAPKERTVQLIKEIENYDRGYYTGIFGYFDGKELDVAVTIRFIEDIEGQFYYKSGGGITALSNAEDEYRELLSKIYVPIF